MLHIHFGSMANDGGNLILNEEEKELLLNKYPQFEPYIKMFLGAEEFINNKKRYCLWLVNCPPSVLRSCPAVIERMENVRNLRAQSSRPGTRKMADYPMLFGENRQPDSNYLLVPRVSSERRRYVPIGFLNSEIIASDAASDATASTLVVSVDSNGHRTKFTITIYSVNFLGSYTNVNGRNRTIAHEIGHAYGLGDISQSSNIMYGSYSTLKQVTTQDIWGMKVVTHQHNHSSSTTGTYSQLNASYHNVVCSSCYGIYKQDHSYVNGICSKCGRAQ